MTFSAAGTEGLLRGKRILIVGRDYFFYSREITSELQTSFGAAAAFHPIEPPGFVYRLLNKVGMPLKWWLERYHRNVIASAQRVPPEIVLFIQVHQIGDIVAKYREAFRSARFVLYYWDSLKTHDYRPYAHYFDKVFTFDCVDAAQVAGLNYLPLFYSNRFRELRQNRETNYDVSFVGRAVSPWRYDELVKLRVWAKANGVSLFDYIVVSPFMYLRLLFRGKLLRHVHFRLLGEERLLQAYCNSRSVLDLPNNIQSGYTMRTFEALGAHRKLITGNPNVVNEDFYTPESVFVMGIHGEMPDRSFLYSQAKFSPAVDLYSLRTWILRLLSPLLTVGHDSNDAGKSIIGIS